MPPSVDAPVKPSTPSGPRDDQPTLTHIPINQLAPFPNQDRHWYSKQQLDDLKSSFQDRIDNDLTPNIEPLHVVPGPESNYIIHSGERRFQAALALGYEGKLLCLVHLIDSNQHSDLMFLSNYGRQDLSAIDLAEAIHTRVERGIWNKDKAMRITNIEKTKYYALASLLSAPDPVKEISRKDHRRGVTFLTTLAKLDEPALSEICEKIKNGSFQQRHLAAALKKQEEEKTIDDIRSTKTKRKPTKFSMKASLIRRLCEDNNNLRQLVKTACRAEHGHARIDTLSDGDFIDIVTTALFDHYEDNTPKDTE